MNRFLDRRDAGRHLSYKLLHWADKGCIVVALPRGGVPVGYEVAEALGAPLDVLVVRRLGVPDDPELAMGAIGPRGVRVLNHELIQRLRIKPEEIDAIETRERLVLHEREVRLRGARGFPAVDGRPVIIVDDGVATGVSVRAAAQVLRALGATQVVLAVPVLPRETVPLLKDDVDELVYVLGASHLGAVGAWYHDFRQTTDGEVLDLLEKHAPMPWATDSNEEEVLVPFKDLLLPALLDIPPEPIGLVIFAHAGGRSRTSPRNQALARRLQRDGFATLLVDLLTEEEAETEAKGGLLRFDVDLLAERVLAAADWAQGQPALRSLRIAYFGASTASAAALLADVRAPGLADAVVSRGGRPDLVRGALHEVQAPTLLVVAENDQDVLRWNQDAQGRIGAEARLEVVPGASHLFEEAGAIEQVARLASVWLTEHLQPSMRQVRLPQHG